jgi:hypothetical protein
MEKNDFGRLRKERRGVLKDVGEEDESVNITRFYKS